MDARDEHVEKLRAAGIIPEESNYRGKKVYVDLNKVFISPGVEIGEGSIIWPNVYLLSDTKIGENCEIGPDVTLEDTTIGNNTRIKHGCEIARSQIGSNCELNPFCYINNSRIGDSCTIWVNVSMLRAEIREKVVVHRDSRIVWTQIGENSNIEAACQLKYIRAGPNCVICHSIIEGDKFDEETLKSGKRSILIGRSCAIGPWAYIYGSVIINPEARIAGADITNSFIGKRVRAYRCRISDAKILHDAIIEEGAWIHNNSKIGPYCEVSRVEIGGSRMPNWSSSYKNGWPLIQALPSNKPIKSPKSKNPSAHFKQNKCP